MKLHFRIPKGLKEAVNKELSLAEEAFRLKECRVSWRHLERAHILGQAWPYEHTKVHWQMIVFACKVKKIREVFGQIPRLLSGGIKSFVGEIPLGNSGGANVPPLKPMEIPEDLQQILHIYK